MKRLWIVVAPAAFVAVVLILLGGDDDTKQPNSNQSATLAQVAGIGKEQNFPLANEDCLDWFPEGDGFVYVLTDSQTAYTVVFPFSKVNDGSALIDQLGEIHHGDVVYLKYPEGNLPIFKVIKIDPKAGGVQLAIVGNISGNCRPTQPGYGPQKPSI